MSYLVTGITRNSTGPALAGVTVNVFKTSDKSFLGSDISDANGLYVVWVPTNDPVFAVGYLTGTTPVAGTTLQTIVPATSWILDGSTLDLDFVNNRAWDGAAESTPGALLTCTRASTGYARDSAGVYSSFANNVLRRTDLGALVEEARTNSIRNNSMQGAVAGTPGTPPTNWTLVPHAGCAANVIGTGTSNGIDYIDVRMVGTLVGSANVVGWELEAATGIAATVGQVFSNSVFIAIVAGSTANVASLMPSVNQLQADGTTSNGAQNGTNILPSLTSTLQRFTQPALTIAGATTAFARPRLRFVGGTSGAAVDMTLRIGWPQFELGDTALSPIRTAAAAATRAADAVSMALPAEWVTMAEFTFYHEGSIVGSKAGGGTGSLIRVDDGSNNNSASLREGAIIVGTDLTVASGNVAQVDTNSFTNTIGQTYKYAAQIKANDVKIYRDGGGALTDTSCAVPVGLNALSLSVGGPNQIVKRVALWQTGRSDAQLAAVST